MDTQLHTIEFPPSKLALIAPDVSLQRYMEIGLRPSLRKFTEFRPVVISQAGLSRYEKEGTSGGNILGSSIAKSGATNVICNISAGIIEDSQELTNDYRLRLDKDIIEAEEQEYGEREQEGEGKGDNASAYASVYTVVEVSKGRNGPPTAEEIELSQSLYETILHSGLIPQDSLKIKLGLKSKDENGNPVILREEDELLSELKPKKSFRFVLYAKIQVYSKTGPLFDLCYGSLLEALKNTRLPEMYIGEKESEAEIKMSRNKRNGSNGTDVEDYDLICDSTAAHNLHLNENRLSWSSTFGVVGEDILLADPEGDAEENMNERIRVVSDGGKGLLSVVIEGGENKINKGEIKKAIEMSKRRAKSMIGEL